MARTARQQSLVLNRRCKPQQPRFSWGCFRKACVVADLVPAIEFEARDVIQGAAQVFCWLYWSVSIEP